MKPAFLALAGAATLSTAFAIVEAMAFFAMVAMPIVVASVDDAEAAGTLYRWKEPDGSLTFSPTAPTDGTPYETIDATKMARPDTATIDAGAAAAPIVSATPALAAPTSASVDTASTFTDSTLSDSTSPALGAAAAQPTPAPAATMPERQVGASRVVASNDKERRCGELVKRVVSLERRLATPLTPEAMDDTVLQMARYQQSVERHCR